MLCVNRDDGGDEDGVVLTTRTAYYSLEDKDTCGVAQGGSSEVLEFRSHKTD